MRILVACEESQRVCKEFRKLGHEAYSCDLQDCSGGYPEWHIQKDVFDVINDNWDLIIAHPPCTYLSKAGARWLYKGGCINEERYLKGLAAKDFFMRIYNADCSCICIENPTPLKIFDLPVPSQIVQPFYFGEPYSKRTCLWLKGLPLLAATDIVECVDTYVPSNTGGFSRGSGGSKGAARRSIDDAKERSKTFLGLARAMAEQWGKEID